jgi:DNA-binding transcriptional regulator YiaG
MPNIASVLKSEISRIARRELRAETASLKKAQASFRADIASLKRTTRVLEQAIRNVAKHVPPATRGGTQPNADGAKARFSAKGLASQRKRLGLSAEACAKLLGTSGQSVYNWEAGKTRPRDSHLAAIRTLRTLSRKAAAARLASLGLGALVVY